MAIYTAAPKQMALTLDIVRKTLIEQATGAPLTELFQLTFGDEYSGYLYLVDEPGGVGQPLNWYTPVLAGTSIALTDGWTTRYANATGLVLVTTPVGVRPYITFTLVIAGTALADAFLSVPSIRAALEIRSVLAGTPVQKVAASFDIILNKSALYP